MTEEAAIAENRIKRICDKLGITESGRKWLDVACDPFKDLLVKPEGYPDRVMTRSVTQTIHQTIEIAKPTSVVGNWDCNIFMDQIYSSVNLHDTTRLTGNVWDQTTQTEASQPRGGVVVRAAASGTPLGLAETQTSVGFEADVFLNADARVISAGFEVHNTTADLYKQGAVITYRQSDVPTPTVGTVIGAEDIASGKPTAVGVLQLVEAPLTATEALDLPGSLQWEAEDGVYVVPIFVEEDNLPQSLSHIVPFVYLNEELGLTGFPKISANTANYLVVKDEDCLNARIPTSLSGAYFTGLSPQTTLTLTVVYYVETFPTSVSPLRRVATASCPEDYEAIELYTKIARNMPTGVPVNDNFLGAFISAISRIASYVAPVVSRVISGAQSVAQIANTTANVAQSVAQMLPNSRALTAPPRSNQNREEIIVPVPTDRKRMVMENNRQIVIFQPTAGVRPNKASDSIRAAPRILKSRRDPEFNRLDRLLEQGDNANRWSGKAKKLAKK